MLNSIKSLCISNEYKAPLSRSIQSEYNALTEMIASISVKDWSAKIIDESKRSISPQDLIAYHIGWGRLLLYWYDSGIRGIMPIMPGEGFTKWDYMELAKYFHTKYTFNNPYGQYKEFQQTVLAILRMCEKEHSNGNLDAIGIWGWCTLKSGKEWPLSKWIQVNTVAPYKRARMALKKP